MNTEKNKKFIEKAYSNIMSIGEELMDLRMKVVAAENKEEIENQIKEKEKLLASLEKDYQKIIKTQASMKRLDKLSEKKKQTDLVPVLPIFTDMKSSMGDIVQTVPKN